MKKVREIECGWCHAAFTTDDGKVKYCCPECAYEARKARARARHYLYREQECARRRKHYQKNKEAEKARVAAWTKAHPNYQHECYLARKAARKAARNHD